MLHNLYGIHRQNFLHKVLLGLKTNPKEINSKLRNTGTKDLGGFSRLPEALRTQRSLNSYLFKKEKLKNINIKMGGKKENEKKTEIK